MSFIAILECNSSHDIGITRDQGIYQEYPDNFWWHQYLCQYRSLYAQRMDFTLDQGTWNEYISLLFIPNLLKLNFEVIGLSLHLIILSQSQLKTKICHQCNDSHKLDSICNQGICQGCLNKILIFWVILSGTLSINIEFCLINFQVRIWNFLSL